MLQEQRGDFVEIDYFSHCSPPYRRIEGIRHAIGREGIPAVERIYINHGEPPKREAACERSLLPTKDQRKREERGRSGQVCKGRLDGLLCSCNARSPKTLVGHAQWETI